MPVNVTQKLTESRYQDLVNNLLRHTEHVLAKMIEVTPLDSATQLFLHELDTCAGLEIPK
jgi:hypothetical protein